MTENDTDARRVASATPKQSNEGSQFVGKPTPGPWRVCNEESVVIRPGGTGYMLATLSPQSFTYGRGEDASWVPPHDIEANAHLIAAAPELLEACRVAEEVLDGALSTPARMAALRALQDAIAKAEGR